MGCMLSTRVGDSASANYSLLMKCLQFKERACLKLTFYLRLVYSHFMLPFLPTFCGHSFQQQIMREVKVNNFLNYRPFSEPCGSGLGLYFKQFFVH